MKTFKPWLSLVCILEIALIGFGAAGPLVNERVDGELHHQRFSLPPVV
jgi:hypothetical protein